MGLLTAKRVEPGEIDAEIAERAMRRIRDYLARHPDQDVLSIGGETGPDSALVVPRAVMDLFTYILAEAASGRGVTIMPAEAELTTGQAAELLNVSRPYVVRLLEEGAIPFRMVGTHRRVRFSDVQQYARQSEEETRAAVDEMGQLGQDLGI